MAEIATRPSGVHFELDNGITISMAIGAGTYSDNYGSMEYNNDTYSSKTAEMAFWYDGSGMMSLDNGDTVLPHVPVTKALRIIHMLSIKRLSWPSVRKHEFAENYVKEVVKYVMGEKQ